MTTTLSSSSRLANFRQKKSILNNDIINNQNQLKLTLPQNNDQTTYQPTISFNNSRNNTRLLKGRIQKVKQTQKESDISQPLKLTINQKTSDLKLVINDQPDIRKNRISFQQKVQVKPKPTHKRVLITKEQPKQQVAKVQVKMIQKVQQKVQQKKQVITSPEAQKTKYQNYFNPHDERLIKEQQIQQSKEELIQNQNCLVLCPEGCGRKFNKKALQKHIKACKLVFMSKRKQFNSQAKRLSSKEQAHIIKQNKLKDKSILGKTKGKVVDKTSENWKTASQDFRSALKVVKKDQKQGQNDQGVLNLVDCKYCQKKFAQVFMQKHLQNCIRKKQKQEKQRKKTKKK